MPRPARVSPDRILAAAAHEFAARGYAGARVDHIARRARVNKAMLYYHFGSKQGLYRTLIGQAFGAIASELERLGAAQVDPAEKLDASVSALAHFIETHDFFPSIMLREMAEGGTHLDPGTLDALAAVPVAFARILQPGMDAGVFRRMHPIGAYFTVVAPILMFVASTRVRQRLAARHPAAIAQPPLTTTAFVTDLKRSLQRAFASLAD